MTPWTNGQRAAVLRLGLEKSATFTQLLEADEDQYIPRVSGRRLMRGQPVREQPEGTSYGRQYYTGPNQPDALAAAETNAIRRLGTRAPETLGRIQQALDEMGEVNPQAQYDISAVNLRSGLRSAAISQNVRDDVPGISRINLGDLYPGTAAHEMEHVNQARQGLSFWDRRALPAGDPRSTLSLENGATRAAHTLYERPIPHLAAATATYHEDARAPIQTRTTILDPNKQKLLFDRIAQLRAHAQRAGAYATSTGANSPLAKRLAESSARRLGTAYDHQSNVGNFYLNPNGTQLQNQAEVVRHMQQTARQLDQGIGPGSGQAALQYADAVRQQNAAEISPKLQRSLDYFGLQRPPVGGTPASFAAPPPPTLPPPPPSPLPWTARAGAGLRNLGGRLAGIFKGTR